MPHSSRLARIAGGNATKPKTGKHRQAWKGTVRARARTTAAESQSAASHTQLSRTSVPTVGFADAEAPVLGCVLVGNCWRFGRHFVIRIKSSRPVTFGASLVVRIAIVSVPRVVVDSAVVPELLLCVCPLYGLCQVGMHFFEFKHVGRPAIAERVVYPELA